MRHRTPHKFTPSNVALVCDALRAGANRRQAVAHIGVSQVGLYVAMRTRPQLRQMVEQAEAETRHLSGQRKHALKPGLKQHLLELLGTGMSRGAACKAVGLHPMTMCNWLKADSALRSEVLGIEASCTTPHARIPKTFTPATMQRLYGLLWTGMSRRAACLALGLNEQSLCRRLRYDAAMREDVRHAEQMADGSR